MKKIICLWGGPGTGKSTTCAAVFAKLKQLGYNAEMNREYIKNWIWEKRAVLPGDQVYITAKQARNEVIFMRQGLDFIVSDSPLALTTFYGDIYDKYEGLGQACRAIVKQHHLICKDLGYKVEHIFLKRMKAYNPSGRNETEATAREYDEKIKTFLENYPINYKIVTCDETAVDQIVALVTK
jgi:hypothetical protein